MDPIHTQHSAPSEQFVSLALLGDVGRPATLTVGDLRDGWEQHRAEVVFDCATSGPRRHRFEGPLLREVVLDAHPLFDARRRKERSRFVLSVSGGDGHHALVAWAEIDADFGDAPVLLATRLDGADLDVAGSQLVVPSDRCGARYVSTVTRVWVGAWQEEVPARLGPSSEGKRIYHGASHNAL
ncbi:molybdopterin-dependent oxidoreductase [Streptomyces sp. NRRL WC-3549]|uniref:molybdopterin-dependent oxidoreductase n=1 Tax=Streptomyces sp. NRRL WC-3549 TaxID=1463925 RepID=UPI0004C8AE4B|nr:molybdopterin-dependent oxidoreductase [Streptomyces sp. NRRL WC-3549]